MCRELVATARRIELPRITLKNLEARGGFEPPHKGFADLSLNHLGTAPRSHCVRSASSSLPSPQPKSMERETGFEPATSTLARSHSTAELLPLVRRQYTAPPKPQATGGTAR